VEIREYTEESIRSAEGLEIFRWRPNEFITSVETEGLAHIAQEIIDNAADELLLKPYGEGRVTIILCHDVIRSTYQMVIQDNGRGVPLGSLWKSFCKKDTSGKYDTKAYKISSGTFGVGAKVTAALSKHFRAISITSEGIGSVNVNDGVADKTASIKHNAKHKRSSGTTVIFEPDPIVFSGIPEFGEQGYIQILNLLRKTCFFHKYNIEFLIYPVGLPEDIWSKPILECLDIIDTCYHKSNFIFTEPTFNRDKWLSHHWNMSRPFSWKTEISNKIPSQNGQYLEYIVKYYYAKFEQGNRFGMVNNISIDDPKSNHITISLNTLKNFFTPLIKDNKIREFYVETYKFPISVAVDIRFEGAKFTGTTKHNFIDEKFRAVFGPSLLEDINSNLYNAEFMTLFTDLYMDIEAKYKAQLGNINLSKSLNTLFIDLNFPEKFKNCSTKDRSKAELFIMEGDSAGGSTGRNSELHAMYTIRGKPLNAVTEEGKLAEIKTKLQKDEIYQDIFVLLGLNPSNPNLDQMNFGGGVFLCTDGDE
jgi:DNA gyrase/topoisomerase IV subunit B